MKKSRFTEEQILFALKQRDAVQTMAPDEARRSLPRVPAACLRRNPGCNLSTDPLLEGMGEYSKVPPQEH
jgi:hypothetical protein